ncbi:MAG: hypothetical protein HFG58_12825 [Lachnospiraceae bacterium]|nr:hypothetical protein [Lachnospiraceae bacterium]
METASGRKLCQTLNRILNRRYNGWKNLRLNFSLDADKEVPDPPDETSTGHTDDIKQTDSQMVLCRKKQIIKDSRLNGNFETPVIWSFSCELPKPAARAGKCLGDLLLELLTDKFTNLLYLEEIDQKLTEAEASDASIPESNCSPDSEDQLEHRLKINPLIKYFLENILDEKRLIHYYAEKIMQTYRFPDKHLLIHISAQLYENRMAEAKMYFADKPFALTKTGKKYIQLLTDAESGQKKKEYPIAIEYLRTIRKLMEMPGEGYGLLILRKNTEYWIDGIISDHLIKEEPAIEFKGYLHWSAICKDQALLEYQNGDYQIPMAVCDRDKDGWKNNLKKLDGIVKDSSLIEKTICTLIASHSHGTSIVFMNKDLLDFEVKRLCKFRRAYKVKPFPIANAADALKGITAMDGALMADLEGKCHAVGAILDGEMMVTGHPGRGARYNSLVNYVHWVLDREEHKGEEAKSDTESPVCFAAILSEDKMVNLEVPPQKKHKVLGKS